MENDTGRVIGLQQVGVCVSKKKGGGRWGGGRGKDRVCTVAPSVAVRLVCWIRAKKVNRFYNIGLLILLNDSFFMPKYLSVQCWKSKHHHIVPST